MKRSPITTIIAASAILLTSLTSLPAQAGTKENNFIGLALGLGALAIMVDKSRDKKKRTAATSGFHSHNGTTSHRHETGHRTHGYDWNESIIHRDRHHRSHKLRQKMFHGHEAPKKCLRQRWTAQGWKTYTSKHCVKNFRAKNHYHDRKQTNHFHNGRGKVVTLKDIRKRREHWH